MDIPDNPGTADPRLMEDVLASIPEAVAVVRASRVLYVNEAFTRIFGYSAEDVAGGILREFIAPEDRLHEIALLHQTVDEFGAASLETVRRNKAGGLVDVSLEIGPLRVNGAPSGYVIVFRDVGERKRMEAKLQHDALHDRLTGLPNRALFLDRLNQAFTQRSRRRGQNCGVLFLDLDHFKEINDTLGHAGGDAVLRAVADRLRGAVRPEDTASRLGGDEFAILVESILTIADIELVATRVLREMEREFDVDGHTIHVGASLGVAVAGPDHTAPELLIRDADFAMYRAKQEGGGRFEIFDKKLEEQAANLQEREQELRRALEQRQFEVWYQPIFQLRSGKLEGFESLLRWRRADGSVGNFCELVSVAEETGLSISLGRETMEAVCRQLRRWSKSLPQMKLTLSINLTQRQFYHPDLIAQVKKMLAASGADPARLLFEVGAAAVNENPDAAFAILERLLECNVRLALDDFGAGMTPLNHLVRLPIDVLKLSPCLTQSANRTGRQAAVLETLLQLGGKLGVQVVAQGIETRAELDALLQKGCALGQGPLLSAVLEPAQAERLAELGCWAFAPEASTGI